MLQAEKIVFSNQHEALGISVSHEDEISAALEALKLHAPCPAIVWIGGAGNMDSRYTEPVANAAWAVAKIAQEKNALIVDGATEAGVMAVLGRVYAQEGYSFPLVGVVAETLVAWSNVPAKAKPSLSRSVRLAVTRLRVGSAGMSWRLEPNHTHFFFVPGDRWGAESPWISHVAGRLSGVQPSVTILSNGRPGGICVQDLEHSLDAGRPVLVMQGTGGLADELAGQPPGPNPLTIRDARDELGIRASLLEHLAG